MKKGSALRDPVEKTKTKAARIKTALGGLNLANAQDSAQPQMPRSKTKITAHKKT
jgi:hypothetical protein